MTGRHLLSLLAAALVAGTGASPAPAQAPRPLDPIDATGLVPYFIADGESQSKYQPGDRQLATWALKAWEASIGGAIHFEPAPEDEALLRVYWVAPGAALYGEMQPLRVNGRRGAAVYIRPDTDALGPGIAEPARRDPLLRDTIVYLTCLHELGHAVGLEHTDDYDDIMYFFGFGGDIPGFFDRYRARLKSRDDIARLPGLSDADVRRVQALYR